MIISHLNPGAAGSGGVTHPREAHTLQLTVPGKYFSADEKPAPSPRKSLLQQLVGFNLLTTSTIAARPGQAGGETQPLKHPQKQHVRLLKAQNKAAPRLLPPYRRTQHPPIGRAATPESRSGLLLSLPARIPAPGTRTHLLSGPPRPAGAPRRSVPPVGLRTQPASPCARRGQPPPSAPPRRDRWPGARSPTGAKQSWAFFPPFFFLSTPPVPPTHFSPFSPFFLPSSPGLALGR